MADNGRKIDLPTRAIVKMYKSGVPISTIAKQYFVSTDTIKKRLIEEGVYVVKKQTHKMWCA